MFWNRPILDDHCERMCLLDAPVRQAQKFTRLLQEPPLAERLAGVGNILIDILIYKWYNPNNWIQRRGIVYGQ